MNPPHGKKRAAKHIAIYAAGTIIRQLASFVMLPIYTSYLSPADYGVVGLLVVMVSLFELMMGARFAQAVPKFFYEHSDQRHRNTVITTALFITAGISLLSTGLVALGRMPISDLLFGSSDYQQYVALYCVLLFTMAIESYGLTFLRLQERPILFISNSVCKLIVQLSLNILLVVHYEMGVMGVVLSALISSLAAAIFAASYILFHTGIHFSRAIAIRLFKFSWPLWVAGLAGLYIGSSNRFFIRIFGDLDQVGLFELATKFSAILALLIWDPFSQWWQTERFKLYQRPDHGVTVFPVVFNGIASVLMLAASGITLFSEPVIMLMSTEPFHAATLAVPVLVYAVLINNLSFFFFFSFLIKEKTIYITYVRYASAVAITIFYFLFIPSFGFVGAAWALAAANTVVFLLSYLASKRIFDNGITLYYVSLVIFVYFVMCAADYFLSRSVTGIGSILLLKIIIFLMVTVFILVAIKRDEKLSEYYQLAIVAIRKKIQRT